MWKKLQALFKPGFIAYLPPPCRAQILPLQYFFGYKIVKIKLENARHVATRSGILQVRARTRRTHVSAACTVHQCPAPVAATWFLSPPVHAL